MKQLDHIEFDHLDIGIDDESYREWQLKSLLGPNEAIIDPSSLDEFQSHLETLLDQVKYYDCAIDPKSLLEQLITDIKFIQLGVRKL